MILCKNLQINDNINSIKYNQSQLAMNLPQLIKLEESPPHRMHSSSDQDSIPIKVEGNSRVLAKTGHWSQAEKLKYLLFTDYHYKALADKSFYRCGKVFKAMSHFIKTRKPNQCRSYHKRMQQYFQSLAATILYFKEKIINYQQIYQLNLPQLREILIIPLPPSTNKHHNSRNARPDLAKQEDLQSKKSNKQSDKRASISMKLIGQMKEDEDADKELPKTDLTIRSIGEYGQQNHQKQNERPRFSFTKQFQQKPKYYESNTSQNKHIKQQKKNSNDNQHSFYSSIANFQQQMIQSQILQQMQQQQWVQCQTLYIAWRSKLQNLLKVNSQAK